MVVFGNNQNQAVSALTDCRESRILDLFASIVDWKTQVANIDQLSFYARTLLNFSEKRTSQRSRWLGLYAPYRELPEGKVVESWS